MFVPNTTIQDNSTIFFTLLQYQFSHFTHQYNKMYIIVQQHQSAIHRVVLLKYLSPGKKFYQTIFVYSPSAAELEAVKLSRVEIIQQGIFSDL